MPIYNTAETSCCIFSITYVGALNYRPSMFNFTPRLQEQTNDVLKERIIKHTTPLKGTPLKVCRKVPHFYFYKLDKCYSAIISDTIKINADTDRKLSNDKKYVVYPRTISNLVIICIHGRLKIAFV